MFGVVGLADSVNTLLGSEKQSDRFGYSEKANELGLKIIEELNKIVSEHEAKYVNCFGGHYVLHAQVEIDLDKNVSAGCRIPVGEEPELFNHIVQSAPFHKYFYNRIGDIFVFKDTCNEYPKDLVDIIKGAFNSEIRYMSVYGNEADLVRVSGYLAKRSEVEKLERGEAVLNNTDLFAMGAKNNFYSFESKVRK